MIRFNRKMFALILLMGLFPSFVHAQNKTWVEDSFADFSDGTFPASGADLYTTQKGTIKSIYRYDLNNDGYIDIVSNSGHDYTYGVPPTLYNQKHIRQKGSLSKLPIDGSNRISVADINKDGYKDAVFLPNRNGVSPRRYLSILWGNKNGWSSQFKTELVTISPEAIAISDLNGDSWPDLIILNGNRWSPQDGPGSVLRVYWGGEEGYQQNVYTDKVIENAVDLVTKDLDGNGILDLLVLLNDPGRLKIYWNPARSKKISFSNLQTINLNAHAVGRLALTDYNNDDRTDILITGGGQELIRQNPTTGEKEYRYTGVLLLLADGLRSWAPSSTLDAPPSSDLQVADLDGDSWPDIVLANQFADSNSIHILWGDKREPFKHSTILPVAYASSIDVHDLDGDSHPDIAVAVYRSSESYDSSSLVFYGNGAKKFVESKYTIPSSGASDICIIPSKNKHRILIANTKSGRYYEDIPTRIYWGSQDGFDPDSVFYYDIHAGYNSAGADLNDDGFVDLILLSIVHAIEKPYPGLGINILWGGTDGLRQKRRTVLNEYGLYDISVADVNRDGYLDLIGSVGYESPYGKKPGIVVWYGGAEGYSKHKRDRVPTEGRPTQNVLADFDKDGYLDIALLQGAKHEISLFWGGKGGFSSQSKTTWPFLRGGDMNVADLNSDGWLDLVASSLLTPNSLYYDYGTYIFWGGPKGFDPSRAQKLVGHGSVGIAIADWNQDGFLDIFLPSYKYTETRESVAAPLYWGSKNGFSDSLHTDLLQNAGHGAMAGDFNRDGKLDLAISNHRTNNSHYTKSQVLYNQGSRFRNIREKLLPTIGSEFIYSVDTGSQYSRTFQKRYISSIFDWKGGYDNGIIKISAQHPGKTKLRVSIRMANSQDSLKKRPWKLLGSQSAYNFDVSTNDGYIQYRLNFVSDNGDRYPEVNKVKIQLSTE